MSDDAFPLLSIALCSEILEIVSKISKSSGFLQVLPVLGPCFVDGDVMRTVSSLDR